MIIKQVNELKMKSRAFTVLSKLKEGNKNSDLKMNFLLERSIVGVNSDVFL